MKRIVSFVVLVCIVAVFGFLTFEVLSGFLLPLFIAVLLVVMFRPLHYWLVRRLGGRERVAAALTTLCVLLIFLLPLLWFISRAATDTLALVSELDQDTIVQQITRLRQRFDLESPPESLQKTIVALDATLARLRDAALPSAAFDKEQKLREENASEALVTLTVLVHELWPTNEPIDKEDARQQKLTVQVGLLQDAIAQVNAVKDDQAALLPAVKVAQQSLDAIRDTVNGGSVKMWLRQALKFDEEHVGQLRSELQQVARPLALGTTQFVGGFLLQMLVGISVMAVALYYFLADGPAMVDQLMELTPLDSRYEVQLLNSFGQLTRAILIAMLLSAFVQGVLAGIGYALAGFESLFLLSVLTMVFAIVPFVGAIPIWGSCCLWLFLHDGRPQAAIALAVYGVVLGIIGDNLVKPWVLHGRSNLHPLLGLLSVLGGVQALGPIGIVVGPMAVAILQTLLVILRGELLAMEGDTASLPDGRTSAGVPAAVRDPLVPI
ncbi:MAG TPA: AI-2E family transporter [Pirellulales bacterium]|nr:AI-2E family transporter [Pirellulales bacterium]